MSVIIYNVGNTTIKKKEYQHKKRAVILISVSKTREKSLDLSGNNVLRMKFNNRYPFEVNYDVPEQVGIDRVAFAVFSFYRKLYPAFLIDSGTFITLDFFDGKVLYPLVTMPGFKQLSSLFKMGYNLSSLAPKIGTFDFPRNPEQAMGNGVFRIPVLGMKSIIEHSKSGEFKVLVTGGNTEPIAYFLKDIALFENAVMDGGFWAFEHGLIDENGAEGI